MASGPRSRRATATDHRNSTVSASNSSAMAVPGLALNSGRSPLEYDRIAGVGLESPRAIQSGLFWSLDADEDTSSKWQPQLAGKLDRSQPHARSFAGSELMSAPRCVEVGRRTLQHQAHGRIVGLQRRHLMAAHGPWICVRQKVGFFQHQLVDVGQVLKGRFESSAFQP